MPSRSKPWSRSPSRASRSRSPRTSSTPFGARSASPAGRNGRWRVAMGLRTGVFPIQETYWAATKFAEHIARKRPVIIVFDDIHWAEANMLELIAYLAATAKAPVLVVATARPDLVDDHPRWLQGRANAVTISLARLSDADGARIVENILGPIGLPAVVQERIAKAAEGN